MDARLDLAVSGRPNFVTTHLGLVAATFSQSAAEARVALEELYRLHCYPVCAFIRQLRYLRFALRA